MPISRYRPPTYCPPSHGRQASKKEHYYGSNHRISRQCRKINRSSRVAGKRRIDRQLLSHAPVNPTPLAPIVESDVEVYFDPPEEYFGLTTPTAKCDYDVYMTGETLQAGVYPHNRDYRFIERALSDGKKETIYSGPNFLDSAQ